MAERITGAQCTLYFTPANPSAASLPGFFDSTDSWSIDYKTTFDAFNEISSKRTVRQMVAQEVAFTAQGGLIGNNREKLMAACSAAFLAGKPTPKWHIRVVGNGSDGKLDRTVHWCTLDDQKLDVTAGNKTGTDAVSFTGEDVA